MMRRALCILGFLVIALSLPLCGLIVAVCVSAHSQSRWATTDRQPRHYGIGWFADGIALYYVPYFREEFQPWNVWVTDSRRSYDYVRTQHSFIGFHVARQAINPRDLYVVLPYWFLLIATAAPTAWFVVRLIFRRRRHRAGL